MNYDHLNEVYEDYLEHYGVKGMKWDQSKKKKNTLSTEEERRERADPYNQNKVGYIHPYLYGSPKNQVAVTFTKDGYEVRNISTDKSGKTITRRTTRVQDNSDRRPNDLATLTPNEYDTLRKRRETYVKKAKTKTAAIKLGTGLKKASAQINKGFNAMTRYLGVDTSNPRKK